MKHFFRMTALVTLAFLALSAGWAQTPTSKTGLNLAKWLSENENVWRTVNNGSWSNNPKDAPTDAELAQILEVACKSQNAVNWNEYFFVAVRDPAEQAAIIGEYWGKGCTTEGTVTILVLADQIANKANHASKYEGYYMQTVFSLFDCGMASAFLSLAAYDLGYNTHFFGTMNGKSVGPLPGKTDYGTSNYDVSRFVKGRNYMRGWGFPEKETSFPVEGNSVLIMGIVLGKPNPAVDVVSAVTHHRRPSNWALWSPDATTPALQK